jgi:integrase
LSACIFSVAFHGFFRIGELIATNPTCFTRVVAFEDITVSNHSENKVYIRLRHTKNMLSKDNLLVTLVPSQDRDICPVALVKKFLALRGGISGPLFSYPGGTPISRHWFTQRLGECLRFAGLDPAFFKGHSFRIGAATEAAANGWSDAQIRRAGRWKSDAFKSYIRL